MKQHNGMRPHDILILLKIISLRNEPWLYKDLARDLYISPSEVSGSLNRSQLAGLIDMGKRKVQRGALLDFLIHGLKYVYPAIPGSIQKGIPTAHSAPVMDKQFHSNENYVWPYDKGETRGQSIEPFYSTVPQAIQNDRTLYDMLALCDTLRIGKAREINYAVQKLKELLNEHPN
jgi:predicted transcriptional regulator